MNKKYTKVKEEFLPDINEKAYLYKHNKSGARVVVIPCEDPNKVFMIGFKTAPINSTGLTHILEHSVLCGSSKYPVKDPFVELLKSSLNTFLNAFTAPDKTMYPVASLNLKDFKNLMDIYLDAVFHPNIYAHEEIFLQEGWHYEILDKKDPIKINGVVYNEMKGAFSNADDVLYREIMHSLYPDTCYGFESGGDPKYIPDLSYQQFLNFHKTFYSPSNSYIFIYGDCDMDERLEYLDNEYLSKYDYIESPSKISLQKPFDKPANVLREYPVSSEEDLLDKYMFSYNVSIGTALDVKKSISMQILSEVLFNSESSTIKQRLINEGICQTVETSFQYDIYQPFLSIVGKGCMKDNKDKFRKIIDEELSKIVENGINSKELESTLDFLEFSTREANFATMPKGLIYGMSALTSFLYDDNQPFEYLKSLKYFDELRKDINSNYFENLVKEEILNSNHKSFVELAPSLTCLKKDQEDLAKKLQEFKNSLTDKEIDELINKNKNLRKYQQEGDSEEAIASMPKLSLEDINENPQDYKIEKISNNTYFSNYFTNGILYKKYLFKLNNFSNEELQYIKLLAKVYELFDTKNHTYQEMDVLTKEYTGGITTNLDVLIKDNNYQGYFTVSFSTLDKNLKVTNDLVNDMLFNSKFEDLKRFKELLAKFKEELQSSIVGSGNSYALRRVLSYTVEGQAYLENVSGIRFLEFLNDLMQNFDTKAEKALDILNSLPQKILTKDSLIVDITSTKDEFELDKPYTEEFINMLFDKYESNNKFIFKEDILNEGFMAPIDVNFVAKGGIVDGKFNGSIKTLNNYLSMAYLWQVVRVKGGAYGCSSRVVENQSIGFASYRDPNILSTIEAYQKIPSWINSLDLSNDELTQAKIGAIGLLDDSCHVSLKGNRALVRVLTHTSFDDIKKNRLELINCTLEDVKNNKRLYQKALDSNSLCVIGNKDKIIENKDLFKEIKNLF